MSLHILRPVPRGAGLSLDEITRREMAARDGEVETARLPLGEALLCILTVAALSWAVIAWIIL